MSGALFVDVIGHGKVIDLLDGEIANPSQAYLFVGPESVGKATVALRFAAGLLGGHTDERSRRLALGMAHPDLRVVEPEGATSIGVDQAREVVIGASMRPVEGERTVFLFPEAGTMTESAANALLKTLEEPSASAVFLLAAESEDDFPATVASRCRTVHMGRVPQDEIIAALVQRGLDHSKATDVAMVAGGRPGLALSLMTQPEVAGFRELWLSLPQRVTPRPGDGQRLAETVLTELRPLVERAISDEMPKDRAQRARRRAEMALLVGGLEILASWYADSAALQLGGPVRNGDLALASLTEVAPRQAVMSAGLVLDAVVDIQANLRREMVLANLFAALGSAE
ncbi:MAG: ATP-binding protein [Acidimicrobiia bacterium]